MPPVRGSATFLCELFLGPPGQGASPLVFWSQETQPDAGARPRSDCRVAEAGESVLVTQTQRPSPALSQEMIWQC